MSSTIEEQIASIALMFIPGIGHIWAKKLVDGMGNAADVFRFRKQLPERLPEVNQRLVEALDCPQAFEHAKLEIEFVKKNHIRCLTLADDDYPSRLRECCDGPVVLFLKGNVNLNALHVINIVGTRKATDYGSQICATFLRDLKQLCPDVLVVSGLAYGIDIHAHRESLANDLSTVAVLAHGLDRIYPYVHRKTAVDMLKNGGLLTEYVSGTNPDAHNFVSRNRIVAGMCDATIVVESAKKGGALITADIAESYHRDCFAFPGRINDAYSLGSNQLIRDNKAALLLSAEGLVKALCWDVMINKTSNVQRNLFLDLSEDECKVVKVLQEKGDLQINSLTVLTEMPINKMNALLFNLEMKGVLRVLVGGIYQLLQ
ncbi:MAG: DNA-processing protein DprA [Bacteroidaceae bacterium]|nr:DNA-processing protein DprA [Bacteroidaceae bacterium]